MAVGPRMKSVIRVKAGLVLAAAAILTGWLAVALPVRAAPESPSEAPADALVTKIVYLSKRYPEPPPLSLLEKILDDEGVQGARLAINEINHTGRFLKQHFEIVEVVAKRDEDVLNLVRPILAEGPALILADLGPADLLALSDLPEAKTSVIFNTRSSRDELRQQDCRANIFHLMPNWAMRADALAQYLVWKKWRRWFVVYGTTPPDLEYLEAIRRAAKKFGAKIVDERVYEFDAGSRRTDSGHQQIQTQMPLLTQGASDHDVVFVADAGEAFGDYLMFRTYEPRPVVGSQGLQAVAWHRAYEQYAGTQLQNRFEKLAGRIMTERDYTAWLGARVIGEVVTRTGKNAAEDVRARILESDFEVAGFKGIGQSFRTWDHQMRQPMLISGPRALVSISPQEGFLHERFLTDTLGFDQPETQCKFEQ
ncbi:branched-chain amino acid ABC transporter substrate-binding protein [Hyphomicrobium nitrativorans NL23]|uniref:Branched-chain amino acid ABC transporter substrate-binding protein n=1 Tax=Hyphomicrobium nitrativorans NL23 TaxID=1029756 RepID=V5SAK1_9HYPH|nr:ABC transporter substrate-binding protein [Hyphomicrobium nitrativorans]AHB47663.1 branched-chain amino acid ABC transporter substrate-binding protein [Hyphomicrobium nitrativorans NL23]